MSADRAERGMVMGHVMRKVWNAEEISTVEIFQNIKIDFLCGSTAQSTKFVKA